MLELYAVPFTEIAKELGTSLMKNMVAIGASSAVLGLDIKVFKEVVEEIFGRKGEKVVKRIWKQLKQAHNYMKESLARQLEALKLEKADGKKRMFMIGNDAIALGAVAGGCRFMPAYPITPASEIMEYLIKKLPEFGGTVIQTEDEIAAMYDGNRCQLCRCSCIYSICWSWTIINDGSNWFSGYY